MTQRTNYQIKKEQVIVISPEGHKLGTFPLSQAVNMAKDMEMDLVEVNEINSICKIIDYGKWKYSTSKKVKKQKKQETKEIKFRPNTGNNDLEYRAKQVDRFLRAGYKVRLIVRFRGREMEHMINNGRGLLDKFLISLKEKYEIINNMSVEGHNLVVLIGSSAAKIH